MKVFMKQRTDIYWEARTNKPCCDPMAMALRNHDLKLTYDNNEVAHALIEHWDVADQILRSISHCPWCGEKIEMDGDRHEQT